jgi:ABC-2 type transport system permease protein
MNNSLLQLVATQFRMFYREPSVIFWAIGFPVLMAWVLGIAFSNKGELKKNVLVISSGNSGAENKFSGTKVIGKKDGTDVKIHFLKTDKENALTSIKRGEANLLTELRNDSTIYYFDPANADAQLTYLMLDKELQSNENGNKSQVIKLSKTGSRYIDFLIPGLIAMGIMNSCVWGIGWNLIEFRMKKLLRRMVATPMKKSYFLISQFITRSLIGLFEAFILYIFAYFYFGITIEGSLAALFIVYIAGTIAFSGIAFLISSRVEKSEAGNGLVNVVVLPLTILSGIFFSYHNFPDWAIPVIRALPLTLLADAMRSIFLENIGVENILLPAGLLTLTGLVFFAVSLKIYKWY